MTTEHQIRQRTNHAANLLLLCHSMQAFVTKMADGEGCNRRTARRIASRAWKFGRDDMDKVNPEKPEMASLLIHKL